MPRKDGKGVKDTVKKVVGKVKTAVTNFRAGARPHAPPKVREFLKEHGDQKITDIRVGRVPLDKPLQKFLNWLSRGEYEATRKRLGYNDIYHTFLVVRLEDGKEYRIEKNSSVEMKPYEKEQQKAEHRAIPLKEPVPLNLFLANGQHYYNITAPKVKRGKTFWEYDASNNNCQYFVDDLIKGNEGTNEIPKEGVKEAEDFTQQDITQITNTLPNFTKSVLDFRQALDHAIEGSGLKSHLYSQLIKPVKQMEGKGFFGDIWKKIAEWLFKKLDSHVPKYSGPVLEHGPPKGSHHNPIHQGQAIREGHEKPRKTAHDQFAELGDGMRKRRRVR